MGRLIEIPNNDLQGTLQVLDGDGITTEHCARLRTDPAYRATVVAVMCALRTILGADIKIGVEEVGRFLRDVFGLTVDYGRFVSTARAASTSDWAIPDHPSLTYARIAEAAKKAKLPLHWYVAAASIDAEFDVRQPSEGLLWTPAGIESTEACPELVGVPCNSLWERKATVVTAREEIILALLVRHVTKGATLLDLRGWTRTASRRVDGGGVGVDAGGGGVCVYWTYPASDDRHGSSRSVVLA